MAGYYPLTSWINALEEASRGEKVRSGLLNLFLFLNDQLDYNPSDRVRIGNLVPYFNAGYNLNYPSQGDFHLMTISATSKNTVQCGTIWPEVGNVEWFALSNAAWLPAFVDKTPPKGARMNAEHISTD